MEIIGASVILVISLIVILEICRFLRWIRSLPREIDNLKRKVTNLEEIIKNQNAQHQV
jgi:hypothetical protein